jgi:hypothetical protein
VEKKSISIHEIDGVRIIVVDNEAFDWGIDEADFKRVSLQTHNDPYLKDNFIGNIQKHFVNCFSEFIGRPVNLAEINVALEKGSI